MPTIQRDWHGQAAGFLINWSLEKNQEYLYFCFESGCPAACDEVSGFLPGLWQRDVSEFFLIADDGSYQEFNLSPTGAWWSARFHSYRKQQCECPQLAVTTTASRSRSGWKAELRVPLDQLIHWTRFQVTAILEGRYFTTGACLGQPDFHRF